MKPLSSYSPESLGFARIWVSFIFLVQVLVTDFDAISRLPTSIMHPPGIMEYFSWKFYDRIVTPEGMICLKLVMIVVLALNVLGIGGRVSGLLAASLVTLQQGILRSFGHFNHDEMVGIICLWILAVTPCYRGLVLTSRRHASGMSSSDYGYPIFLMRSVMAWAYCSAGLLKLRIGGIDWFSQDSLPVSAIKQSLDNLHDTEFQLAFLLADYRMIVPLMAFGAVLWEITWPICLFVEKLRWFYLPIGIAFHIGTMMMMNITFYNQLAMYALFLDWDGTRCYSFGIWNRRNPSARDRKSSTTQTIHPRACER